MSETKRNPLFDGWTEPASQKELAGADSKLRNDLLAVRAELSKLKNDLLELADSFSKSFNSPAGELAGNLLTASASQKELAGGKLRLIFDRGETQHVRGGRARSACLTPERRREIAMLGVEARRARRAAR